MDLSNLFKKLPNKMQNSEKFIYYSVEFSKLIRNLSKPKQSNPNPYLNFLFKSTNIEPRGFLKDVQVLSVELLRFIDNVCKKYNLDYFLAYGTLLGAVRHRGFVPWDDDLDIIMLRQDYNELIKVLPKEINENNYLRNNCGLTKLKNFTENLFENNQHIYTDIYEDYFFDSDYKQVFLQFALLKPFVKIDVFPFDYVKDDFVKKYNKKYLSQKFYFRNLYDKKDFSYGEELNKTFEKLGLSIHETNFIAEGVDSSRWEDYGAFKKEVFYPVKEINFENYFFKGPNKPHEILRTWYGESYMDIPSDIKVHEFAEYNLILYDYNEKEMSIAFKKTTMKLKEINDNFK